MQYDATFGHCPHCEYSVNPRLYKTERKHLTAYSYQCVRCLYHTETKPTQAKAKDAWNQVVEPLVITEFLGRPTDYWCKVDDILKANGITKAEDVLNFMARKAMGTISRSEMLLHEMAGQNSRLVSQVLMEMVAVVKDNPKVGSRFTDLAQFAFNAHKAIEKLAGMVKAAGGVRG